MLSIQKLSSSSAASSYYQQADYYTKGESGVDIKSEWLGGMASQLGLTGEVEQQRFKELLDGQVSPEVTLGRTINGQNVHAPGWDLTFSAPKSVSILALVGGDSKLVKAHDEAVKAVIALIENKHINGRHNLWSGRVQDVPLKQIAAAKFTHTTSRVLDPQLHSHLVLMNMGVDADGKIRSIHSPELFENKMLLGQIYRSELAYHIQKLGYQLDWDANRGLFEIAGVSKELIKDFSTRRQQVLETADLFGYEGGKALKDAALRSRKAKQDVSPDTVVKGWDSVLEEHKLTQTELVSQAKQAEGLNHLNQERTFKERLMFLLNTKKADALDFVSLSVDILAHYESSFKEQEIVSKALELSQGKLRYGDVQSRLNSLIQAGSLIQSDKQQGVFTTRKTVEREKYMIDLLGHGKEQYAPWSRTIDYKDKAYFHQFTNGQAESFERIMESRDRFFYLQGYAGTGKTFMMNPLVKELQGKGIVVRGFAPYGSQAKVLEKDTGLKTQTLKSHLMAMQNAKVDTKRGNEVWIVDEAGTVNAKDMADLMTFAHKNDVRVILSGDEKQINAIESGNPFGLMIRQGGDHAVNGYLKRYQNKEQRDAVYDLIKGDVKRAFERLQPTTYEFKKNEERIERAVHAFIKESGVNFKDYSLIVPDIENRDHANSIMRRYLKEQGKVSGPDHTITNLRPSKLDGPAKQHAFMYKKGEMVRFHKTLKRLGVEKDEYFRVTHVGDKYIRLEGNGKLIQWDPMAKGGGGEYGSTAYREDKSTYAKGDIIRWKDKNQDMNLVNGDLGRIEHIDKQSMTVAFKDGKRTIDLGANNQRHFELAYVQTFHAAQGQTVDQVFAVVESWRKNLINQSSFYVAVSRAKHQAHIFVDDSVKVKEALEKRLGDKTNGIESITRYQAEQIRSRAPVSTLPLHHEALQISKERERGQRHTQAVGDRDRELAK